MTTMQVAGSDIHMNSLSFRLRPVPPFRLDLTVWALRRRARNIVDRWDGSTYRRVFIINDKAIEAAVAQSGPSHRPLLTVSVSGQRDPEVRKLVTELITRVLGLRTDLRPFYELALRDRRLAPLVEQFRGLKPPRFPSVFEALVNGIACQQLSLTVGIELLNRIAGHCGHTISAAGIGQRAFPRAEDFVHVKARVFRSLGFSYSKARFLLALSRGIVEDGWNPERLQNSSNEIALEELTKLRGVGRWTAEYVLLRGLGRIDTFPGDDVGARNRLASWLGRDAPLDYDGVRRAVRRWNPYAGLVYFHLLLAGLTESGELKHENAAQLIA